MTRLKCPDGELYEEYIVTGVHYIEGGECAGHNIDSSDGSYTGVFWFRYPGGKMTRRYRERTAPQWLLAIYYIATEGAKE